MRRFSRFLAANFLPEDLFRSGISLDRTKELFKEFVMIVEMENHNYCNRTCWFCPNSYIDRISKKILMPDKVFNKIIDELKEINYENVVLWSYYHEALAHESIYERIAKTRAALPKAFLKIYTNGDYLNKESLKKIENVGLNRIRVSLYLPDGKEQDQEAIKDHLNKFQERTGLKAYPIELGVYKLGPTSVNSTLFIADYYNNYISSRAGSVKNIDKPIRTSTCLKPLVHMIADYTGNTMLCCETRADVPEHKSAIIGNLNNDHFGLFESFRQMAPVRKDLIRTGKKKGVCAKCDVDNIGEFGRYNLISNILAKTPGLQNRFNKMYWKNFAQKNKL